MLVSNVEQPAGVLLNGKPVAERDDVERGSEAGWRYDTAHAYLSVRVAKDGESAVQVKGARFRRITRLPRLATKIDFTFDNSLEGWVAQHHVGRLSVRDGAMAGAVTGPDPYLVRGHLRVEGDACPVLLLRMRVSAGRGAQLFWTTKSSPHFAEDKTIGFAIRADGKFHEYRLAPGRHAAWAGQTITAIRIDPTTGTTAAEFAIDSVRGAKE